MAEDLRATRYTNADLNEIAQTGFANASVIVQVMELILQILQAESVFLHSHQALILLFVFRASFFKKSNIVWNLFKLCRRSDGNSREGIERLEALRFLDHEKSCQNLLLFIRESTEENDVYRVVYILTRIAFYIFRTEQGISGPGFSFASNTIWTPIIESAGNSFNRPFVIRAYLNAFFEQDGITVIYSYLSRRPW